MPLIRGLAVSTIGRSFAGFLVIVGLLVLYVGMGRCATGSALEAPGFEHWLGTDRLGRDVGQRTSEAVGYTTVISLAVLGSSALLGAFFAGLSALYYERVTDRGIVLVAESIRAFPTLLLALLLGAMGVRPSFVLILYFWIPVWRLLRAVLVAQLRRPYALAARLQGMSGPRVVLGEVLPNVLPGVVPYFAGILAEIISAQCALEFLGFGPPLDQPSLGGMVLEAFSLGLAAPWTWLPSLVAIIAGVLGLASVGRMFRERRSWAMLA